MKSRLALLLLCLVAAPALAAGTYPVYGINFDGAGAETSIKNGKGMYSLEMIYTRAYTHPAGERAKLQNIVNAGFKVTDAGNTGGHYRKENVDISVLPTRGGTLALPGTTNASGQLDWNAFKTYDGTTTFTLPKGFHELKLVFDTGAVNIDWFELVRV
ncbi:MAG TPA: hypothetical protein VEU33_28785 [Archangium sp.]|nr:hypothetical protein [Archangium sp.]